MEYDNMKRTYVSFRVDTTARFPANFGDNEVTNMSDTGFYSHGNLRRADLM